MVCLVSWCAWSRLAFGFAKAGGDRANRLTGACSLLCKQTFARRADPLHVEERCLLLQCAAIEIAEPLRELEACLMCCLERCLVCSEGSCQGVTRIPHPRKSQWHRSPVSDQPERFGWRRLTCQRLGHLNGPLCTVHCALCTWSGVHCALSARGLQALGGAGLLSHVAAIGN